MTGGHAWFISVEADGEVELTKAVRGMVKRGADCIKLVATGGVTSPAMRETDTQFNLPELRAGVAEAHRRGRRVTVHGIGIEGIKASLEAGVDTIEHGVHLDDEAIDRMLEQQVILVPTLSALDAMLNGDTANLPNYVREKAIRARDSHLQSARRAYERGVRIACGTDAGTPFNRHGENQRELKLLMSIGMSREEVIDAATTTAAHCLARNSEIGCIRPGAKADLVGYHAALGEMDVAIVRQPELVISRGIVYRNIVVSQQE
jgi:imidazolonepropionase-like amidohydrolase